jgi:hypothetical protein
VSRGPGKWQRELLSAVSGVHTATVSGVVRTTVPEPDRNDFTAARRGAKGLAMEGKVTALYVYACQRCGHVQDHEPERCCGLVRSSLAVTRPDRALPHLAPPPTGTTCPAWIGVSVASRQPTPPGRLAVPGIADLASLAMRRLWERLEAGEASVSLQDAAALVRLAREIKRDDAVAAAAAARARAEMFQKGLSSTLWTAKRHIDPARWRAFMDDLRRECEPFAPRDTPSPGRR